MSRTAILFVGLGNPGARYRNTRHNLGFWVLDRFAKRQGVRFRMGNGPYRIARADREGLVLMAKPLTFMNRSGAAVTDLVARYGLPLDRVLVVCDDFNLPFGKLRLRAGGRSGGHQGLSSIIRDVRSTSFPRLRLGIGPPAAEGDVIEFVLSPFLRHERGTALEMVERAVQALGLVAEQGVAAAMNACNRSSENNNPCSRSVRGGNQMTEGR